MKRRKPCLSPWHCYPLAVSSPAYSPASFCSPLTKYCSVRDYSLWMSLLGVSTPERALGMRRLRQSCSSLFGISGRKFCANSASRNGKQLFIPAVFLPKTSLRQLHKTYTARKSYSALKINKGEEPCKIPIHT